MVDIGVVEVLVSVALIILVLSDSNFAGGGGGVEIHTLKVNRWQ